MLAANASKNRVINLNGHVEPLGGTYGAYVPVKASSGSTRRSRFRSRDSSLYKMRSACSMLAGTSPSVGVNCNVAILIVVVMKDC